MARHGVLFNGKKDTRLKYLFYVFYPAHLLALWALAGFIR